MRLLHRFTALVAIACVTAFWGSTVVVELFGSPAQVAAIKQTIVYGLFLLVPAIALTGYSGSRLAQGRYEPGVAAKRRRMPWIAAIGVLVLIPTALYLNHLAARRAIGTLFYSLQALELVAGAVNLRLMAANLLAGRRLARSAAPGKTARAG